MIGIADIDAWDDDIRATALDDLRRGGWDRQGRAETLPGRTLRLLARFRSGETMTTRELADLRNALTTP